MYLSAMEIVQATIDYDTPAPPPPKQDAPRTLLPQVSLDEGIGEDIINLFHIGSLNRPRSYPIIEPPKVGLA